MRIGSRVKTNKNGLYGVGVIMDRKIIRFPFGDYILYQVWFEDHGLVWVNGLYLKHL